jgi:uncharacterized membrane protein YoaT (DUF817 family)
MQEFLIFGLKQARACIFAGSFLALLMVAGYVHIPGLVRADILFVGAILIQVVIIATKLETVDEAKVILLFHLIGLALELYKTSPAVGSWSYPEPGFFRIATVPLYSGFMYASVGSYIAQAWKIFKLELVNPPSYPLSGALSVAIYLNFFTNHFFYDFRWLLSVAVVLVYRRTWVTYLVTTKHRRMPLAVSFILIAAFIWIAENIGTFYGAWLYPHQVHAWSVVSLQKVSSWSLLVIISFVLIAYLKHVKSRRVSVNG